MEDSTNDWEIAQNAEKRLKTVHRLAEELGLSEMEVLPYGHYVAKLDFARILGRLEMRPNGKYIAVTAMTPTPLGEGKSTTTMGLVEGLGKLGKKVIGAIRQPSGGPTFNIKGSAAGGGLAQCVPLTEFSLGLTGDVDAVTNANNLAMVALTSRIQHEFNHSDKVLEKKKLKRLNIDPRSLAISWALDFCAQSLRRIVIGMGDKMDGFLMESSFQITPSSEIMAILAVSRSLADMRDRIGKIAVARDRSGNVVTTRDLEVDGAMAAIMSKAINPNLLQTIEGQPVLVHAGPFANIAIGQSSIIADLLGLKLADYHVTETGFGSDIGFQKFWNLKCRLSGLAPQCAVIVCTARAVKMHGGGPKVFPGKRLNKVYLEKNTGLIEKGLGNLIAHIEIVKKSGVVPVVCINHFAADDEEELGIIRKAVEACGVRSTVGRHWEKGGEGGMELARAVADACEEKSQFKFLYELDIPLVERIGKIAREVYGADDVIYTAEAREKIDAVQADPQLGSSDVCMVKTQYSLSHDPALKGRPKNWSLPVRDLLIFRGAGFVVPVAGDVNLMPGTASNPNFRNIDIDVNTGKVKGLF